MEPKQNSKVFRWRAVAMGVVSLLFLVELALGEVATAPAQTSTDAATQAKIEELIGQLVVDKSNFTRRKHAKALADIGQPAVQPLIEVLQHESSFIAAAAAYGLGLIGDPKAVDPLVEGLGRMHDPYVRQAAAEALGAIGDKRAVKPLTKALEDLDVTTCMNAAYALGQIGDSQAVQPLMDKMGHEERFVRRYAGEALWSIDKLAYVRGKWKYNWPTYTAIGVVLVLISIGAVVLVRRRKILTYDGHGNRLD
jgi:HEAT repeat protein